MSELSEGRGRAASARLLAVADTDLYRRNPFRITGLPTDAPRRLVRETRQRTLSRMAVDAAPDIADQRLPLPESPSADTVRSAFDELADLEHRLVDELFWWWGEPGDCGCPVDVHRAHDAAVRAHASALDGESGVSARHDTLWRTAAKLWTAVVDREEFWNHLHHRVRVLGDRRLDESTVDGLRRSLPRALMAPLIMVVETAADPTELLRGFDAWGFDAALIEDARTAAAASTLDRVTELLKEVRRLVEDKTLNQAADVALTDLAPAATRLEQVLPHQRFRRSATTRDDVATAVNNVAVALFESARRPIATERVAALFTQAAALAVSDETKALVQRNSAIALVGSVTRRRSTATTGAGPRPAAPAGGAPRRPGPPASRRPSDVRRRGGGQSLARWVGVVSYIWTLIYLLAGVAHAPPWLTVVAAVIGWPIVTTAIANGAWPRWFTMVGLVVAVDLAAVIVRGTGALSHDAMHVPAYLLTLLLIVIAIGLALRKSDAR